MSGRGTGSGTDFQNRVGAYAAAHVLARRSLPRFGLPRGIPVRIAFEQDGAGDDIHLVLADGLIVEIQAKHGLDADDRLGQTISTFSQRLVDGRRAVLVVDRPTSSETVAVRLKEVFELWRNDQTPALTEVLERRLTPLLPTEKAELRKRISVGVVDLDSDDTESALYAVVLLQQCLRDPLLAEHAWAALITIAATAAKGGHSYDRERLIELLRERGLDVAPDEHAELAGRLSTSGVEATAAGLRDELPDNLKPVVDLIEELQPSAALALLERADRRTTPGDRHRAHRLTLRGVALLQCGQRETGRAALEEALGLGHRSATALVNLAFLEEDAARAVELAREATSLAPSKAHAWAVRIHIGDVTSDDEIPDTMRLEWAVQLAFAAKSLRAGRPRDAIDRLRAAGAVPAEFEVYRADLLAAALLTAAEQRDVPDEGELAEALRLLDVVLAQAPDPRSELRRTAAWNRGIALEMTGDLEGALAAHRSVATEQPMRAETAVRYATRALALHRDLDEASRVLAGVAPQTPFILAMRARVLAMDGDEVAAREQLAAAVASVPESGPRDTDELITIASAALCLGNTTVARDTLDAIDAAPEPRSLVMRARLAGLEGRESDAVAAFEAAIALAAPHDAREIRVEYGAHLRWRGAFREAFAVLAEVPLTTDRVARLVADVAYSAGELTRAEAAASKYPDAAWAARMSAYIAGARADYKRAEAAFLRWATLAPGLSEPLVSAAALAVDREDLQRGGDLLARLNETQLVPTEKLRVARLWVRVGDASRASKLAFDALRDAPDDDAVVLDYFDVTRRIGMDRVNEPPSRVSVGVSVTLQPACGPPLHYLITAASSVRSIVGELAVSDPLATRLLGKSIGDVVELQSSPPDHGMITELSDQMTHGHRWALEQLQRRGPEGRILRPVPVPDGDVTELIASMKATLQPHADSEAEILAMYRTLTLPLGVIAHQLGTTMTRAYGAFLRDPDRRLRVEEVDATAAMEAAGAARLVLTRSALLTVELLGLLDVLGSGDHKLLVTPGLLRHLHAERAEHAEVARHGRRGFDLVGGRLAILETTPQEGRHGLDRTNALIAWVENHCTPTYPDRPPNSHDAAWQKIGEESELAVLAAARENAVLFCDDLGLRRLALGEYKVRGTSSYSWLLSLQRSGHISDDELQRHLGVLLRLGHTAVPLTVEHMVAAVREDAERLQVFRRVIGHLREQCIDPTVAAHLVVRVLRLTLLEPELRQTISSVADHCFDALLGARPLEQQDIARHVRSALRRELVLLPAERDRLLRQLAAFLDKPRIV